MNPKDRSPSHRGVRSFVIRAGRMTKGQQRGLDEYWPHYGLKADDGPDAFTSSTSSATRIVAEIGFGMGNALLRQIEKHPDTHFLGIEVHPPGVGHLLNELGKKELNNANVYHECAKDVMQHGLPEKSIDKMQVFFPDPWHKKRHHKRRLIQADAIAMIARVVKPGGFCHLATDWENYAEHMETIFAGSKQWKRIDKDSMLTLCPIDREHTRFEARGLRLGHKITDLIYQRTDPSE